MHRNLLLFFYLMISCTLFAQPKDIQDPKAKVLLDELSSKTKAYTSIKAEFTIVIQGKDKSKKPETQKGVLQLKGNKYKLELKGQEIISDGKTSWTFLKDNNEMQINDVDPNANEGISPTTIFSVYEKGFKSKFESETETTQTISLYPSNPDKKKFHTLRLVIDKSKKQISSFTVFMKDGTAFEYTLNSFLPNVVLPEELFVFDPKSHPGVEIVDLRDH